MRKPLYCCPEYIVDSDGYVLSKRFGTPLKYSINMHGYAVINISINGKPKGLTVHNAVAHTFLENDYQEGLQVNHKDGNKLNNKLDNLEWVTQTENMRHAVDVLGNCINDKNGNAKGVQAIDENGNVIYDYNSIAECAKDISRDKQIDYRYIQNSIWRVLKGYRKTYLKLKWVYK